MEKLKVERRPYKTGPRKDKKLFIRVTEEEKAYLEQVACSKGITLSNLVMSAVEASLNTRTV